MSHRAAAPARAGAAPWRRAVAVGLLAAGLLWSCSGRQRSRTVEPGWSQRGTASWYGHPFHGRRTANGEVYDMHLLTAAHPWLPFGTLLEVRDLATGRRVEVRVNDRGPFVRGRIIDLSWAAAVALGIDRAGLARVELVVRGAAPPRPPADLPEPAVAATWTVQVAAFNERWRAEAMAAEVGGAHPVRIEEARPYFRVQVGSFASREEADELLGRLLAQGYAAFVTRQR